MPIGERVRGAGQPTRSRGFTRSQSAGGRCGWQVKLLFKALGCAVVITNAIWPVVVRRYLPGKHERVSGTIASA